jgi:hypothetical protein
VLWRAIARGAIIASANPSDGYVVLSWGLPAPASGGKALRLVTGTNRVVTAVLDISRANVVAELAALADR